MPIMVERCELRTDSGGAGEHRGGLCMRREVRLLGAEASYSVLSDRAVIPPYGVLGGSSASPYQVSVLRDGRTHLFATAGKVTGYPLRQDDVVVMLSAGGGGYGDPLARDADAVASDQTRGYVSAEQVRNVYGVVLGEDGRPDRGATESLRRQLTAKRFHTKVIADNALDPYVGARGRRRTLEISRTVAATVGVKDEDMVEMLGFNPAPLRAWVTISDDAQNDGIRLDAFGRAVLGVDDGDTVFIRYLYSTPLANGMAW